MYNIRRVILVLSLALLLIGIVPGCGPTPPPPTEPPEEATATPEPTVSEEKLDEIIQMCLDKSIEGRGKQSEIPPDLQERGIEHPPFKDLMYVKSQVIVTGPPTGINEVIKILGLALKLVDTFALSEQMEGQEDLYKEAHLYRIENGKSVEQVVCEINEFSKTWPEFAVFADPNYHMSPAGWAGGGSPWTQNGEWTGQLEGGGLGEAPSEKFQTQWAFGRTAGIGLFDDMGVRVSENHRGEGIRVGIFDTSPFTEVGEEGKRKLSEEKIPLTVWHPKLTPAPDCPGYDLEDQNISSHGLFVAGLVHAVAPSSEIYLVRVLENDGCGDLFTIAKSIDIFMAETLQDKTVEGIVISASFGVHQPPNPSSLGLPEEVYFLEEIMKKASDQGAVVVAAAGNDSFEEPDSPSSMELPAGYSFVIGVAASNIERERGCFSNANVAANTRDVAAPGGDGKYLDEKTPCVIPNCLENPNLCLISLVRIKGRYVYAYWVGTSFAAPLVSGEAALLLEAGVPPADVADEITGNACPSLDSTLSNGIINLPQVLLGASCPP